MKKIFYFIASAIVALGAVACQNEIEEGIDANTSKEGLSFTAVIDDATRIALGNDGKTAWDGDDTIVVTCNEKNYEFTNTKENPNTFTCTATGVTDIIDLPISATYSYNNDGKIDSEAGFAGSVLHCASGVIRAEGAEIQMVLTNSLLYFTAAVEVTFTSSVDIFVVDGVAVNELTVAASNDVQYVAIMPASTNFAYKSNDIIVKSLNDFEFGVATKYNLGTLESADAVASVNDVKYANLDKAIEAAKGAVVTLLADATVSKACVINANGFALTAGDGYLALKNYANDNGYYDVVAATKSSWRLAGTFNGASKWDIASGAQFIYNITDTNNYVAPAVELKVGDFFKFFYGANAWDRWVGSYTGKDGNDSDVYTTLQNHPKTNKYVSNDTYNNKKGNFGVTEAGTYDIYLNVGAKNSEAKIWVAK